MNAAILTIGDEILNGSTIDTNASFIAENATAQGIKIVSKMSVSDQAESIAEGLHFLKKKANIIFITGGLGPTKDDITIKTLAHFLNQPLVFNEENYLRISQLLNNRSKTPIIIDKDRCCFPEKAILLHNEKGTAPGMWLESDQVVLVSMPGVPLEMKQIFVDEVLPKIKKHFQTQQIINLYIQTAGIWESIIAQKIEDIETALPKKISLAYLPKLGQVKLRLTGYDLSFDEVNYWRNSIVERINEYVFSLEEKDTLEKVIGEKLLVKKQKMTLAESCTGGLVASKIVGIAGSSAYFDGSMVSYSDTIKNKLLNVKEETLTRYGAVSKETVKQMAKNALEMFAVDYSIAISGIAGPSGGTSEKPVGLVWIAVASKDKIITEVYQFWKHRAENIELSAVAALHLFYKGFLKN